MIDGTNGPRGPDTRSTKAIAKRLDALARLRQVPAPFLSKDAALALDLPIERAHPLLANLVALRQLIRLRNGVYQVTRGDTSTEPDWDSDPWSLAAQLFSPGYVGGISAAAHWDMALDRSEVVFFTATSVGAAGDLQVGPLTLRLRVTPNAGLFGLRPSWRRDRSVYVSSPTRTIVDMLNDPSVCYGAHQMAEIVGRYFAGEHRDDEGLRRYAWRLGSHGVYNRLGYLLDQLHVAAPRVREECIKNRGWQPIPLDPSVRRRGRVENRWRLRLT
jgi:predicted transcriptional regulator of viral defense system